MDVLPFTSYLGIEIERMENGEAVAKLRLASHHRNRRGVVHGGVISSLLDTALGAAVVSAIPKEWWCATTSLSVQFLEGRSDGVLKAHGNVLRRGRRVAFAGGEVRDEVGRLVAAAQGSWHLWPHHPGRSEGAVSSSPWVVRKNSGERLRVGKILAVGRNYAEHNKEMGNRPDAPPVVFLKPATAIVHDGGTVRVPSGLGEVHHEVELVVVVGKEGRAISEADAMEHVLGYAVGLDMTLRELQAEAKRKGEPWTIAKGFDSSAPVSPFVPRNEVGDGSGLTITLDVNGKRRQEGNTSMMLHPVAALVASVSRFLTLEVGDLLFTGTPSGVGPVVPGDVLEARIEKIGTLRVEVAASD
jgi:5-carboxymethyl-2-hydroxymuconate isomerase